MKLFGKKRKLLAFALAACMMCAMPGMTSLAGSTGLGAAKSDQEIGGPGMEQSQAEDAGQAAEGGQAADAGQAAEGGQAADAGQAAEGGQAADAGQAAEGGQAADAGQAAEGGQPAQPQNPLQINYSTYFRQQGWTETKADNTLVQAPGGSWVTAMKANLINIPEGAQVGVAYQVNLSGSGWLDWAEDGAETGGASGEMPLESIRMKLTGSSAVNYDLYYRVFQNGAWTDWAMNEAPAGQEGAGLRVDGIRVGIVAKGAEAPADPVTTAAGIDPTRPMIALTFDDGPRAAVTNRILDSLQANGGRATFFMLGSNVNANAASIQRMVAQGCEVANHTHDHKYISKLNASGITSQISSTNQKIQAICGVAPTLMRPPGGYYDAASLGVLAGMGVPAIMWSIDTRDWQHRNAQKTIDTVLSQVKDGDIILMHDIYGTTADAAVVLIPELTARGYQLVTVSELASFRGGMAGGHT